MLSPEYAILSSEAEPGRFPWSPGGQLEPENGAPPQESPPAESAPAGQTAPPAETQPAEGEEFNPFETESAGETVETEGADSPGADMPAGPELPWWTIGLLAALAAAAIALTVTLIIRRRRARRRGVLEVTELPFNGAAAVPAVGKLHAQGARSSQQDSFSVSQAELYPSHGLLAAVADGMGGLADGDRVSQEAVRAVMSSFLELPRGEAPQTGLLRLLADANGAVNRLLGFDRLGQCGSTLLLGLVRDGAFHFHGFMAGEGLEVVDSGTLDMKGFQHPRRPRSAAQRAQWLEAGARVVYNLPQWKLGFTTAIKLYGEYSHAVGYVCKYVGKQEGQRPLGRWYFSGGALAKPEKIVACLDYRQLKEDYQGQLVELPLPGQNMLVIHTKGEKNEGGSGGDPVGSGAAAPPGD